MPPQLQRTVKDIQRTAHLQKELLLHGIDSLNANSKTGGIMVYSTCSVSVEEVRRVYASILISRSLSLSFASLAFARHPHNPNP